MYFAHKFFNRILLWRFTFIIIIPVIYPFSISDAYKGLKSASVVTQPNKLENSRGWVRTELTTGNWGEAFTKEDGFISVYGSC